MSRRREWSALTLILLIAAGLRFWGLGDVPPGFSHDEVANWLIARDILDGDHAVYFTAAYGHEPLYQYAQAATVALFGDHWLGLRWPSAAFSLLGLAASYTLLRHLFSVRVALLAIAWSGVSFWPLFYARVSYRAILLPLVAALSAYFFLRVLLRPLDRAGRAPGSCLSKALTAGLFVGLSIYTYMAARILPFILAALVVYVKLVRPRMSIPWCGVLVIFLIAALVSAPLLLWLAIHPGAESRVAEVRLPLDRLLVGDPSLVWQNLVANLKFFTFAGDPWPRYNVPGRPVFAEPLGATLFVIGLLITLWRWRDPRYGFLLIWLIGSLSPSIVTSEAPSSIRNILGLVVVFAFPAIAVVELGRWVSSKIPALEFAIHRSVSLAPQALTILALALCAISTARDYFIRWPRNAVVRFDYQADLIAVGKWMERLPAEAGVTVAGLSVDTMDAPSLALASRRDVTDVRLCDTRGTLSIPSSSSDDRWFLIPRIVPFDEDIRQQLMDWGAEEDHRPSFTSYRLSGEAGLHRGLSRLGAAVTLPDDTAVALPALFGGQMTFLGYKQPDPTHPGDPLRLLTYWRVEDPPPVGLKAFAHLIGPAGEIVAQDDGLASPSDRWHRDDILIQKHVLALPDNLPWAAVDAIELGLYDRSTNRRLPVLTADHLELRLELGEE